jgi:hypothetical protein
MIEISLAGLVGAVIGIVVAALAYAPILAWVQRHLGMRPGSGEGERPEQAVEHALSLLPRVVLAGDILLFAGLGYWLAAMLAG